MKNILIIFLTSLMLVACKTKEDKVQDFVKMYNGSSSMMINQMIRSTSASSTSPDQINIDVNTTYQSNDIESELVSKSLPDLIAQAIKSEKLGKELFESGVKFNLKVYSADSKVIIDKMIDNKNVKESVDFKAIAAGEKPSSDELNQILEAFNKNLPIVDQTTGTKIVSIKADEHKNIIYTNEVPDSYIPMLKVEGTDKLMKDEMVKTPQIRQIFTQTSRLGVNNLKYLYTDSKGNMIKEIVISKNDIK
ncbi:hypothetical protein [Chryseobacterium chendengshani]|uniref:hypothetical protein n=1 Tax=Chryseobacterium sp. LJ756 TaxID=2864113 RepID=UPI001C6401D5|nr:hypothetical protein [Chryseobacterium sp. LJ756]MBW7675024.1 hypothetical protein [Chryseobacterium sp. LJ756]